MKKISIFLSSILLLIMFSSYNPNNYKTNFKFFQIKKIEIINLKILENNYIEKLFFDELYNTSLLVLKENKIEKILKDNKIIDYVKFKKIYPDKLKIIIFEKETIAIINNKKKKNYLIKSGEEIEFFNNIILEKLPNIFGEQKNFLEIYSALKELEFPISEIKSFYHFDIGRWDIMLKNDRTIKLPVKNFKLSLLNYIELSQKIDYERFKVFDYRIKDQLILN